jgi:uncharacterized protein (DUF2141 family)
MKRVFLPALSLFLLSGATLLAQSDLQVEIVKLKSDQGMVIVNLLDRDEELVEKKSARINDRACILVFKDLPDGQYAVRFIHDENSNEKLDTNFIGIPKEGFGFSNDAFGRFGPKDFEEWLFPVAGDTKISLSTRYL